MNGDTEITSMEEKTCELMESLQYTIKPPKWMNKDNRMTQFYEKQFTLRNIMENKVSNSIPYMHKEDYLAFGQRVENPHGSDNAIYCGAIVNRDTGKKLGEFMYHGRTGKVDYFSMSECERQRTSKTPYFEITQIFMRPNDFDKLCKDVMGLSERTGRLQIRPLDEDEMIRVAEAYKEDLYVPSDAELHMLANQTMAHNYVSPTYMSELEQAMCDMKEVSKELHKEKAKAEAENDYGRTTRSPY